MQGLNEQTTPVCSETSTALENHKPESAVNQDSSGIQASSRWSGYQVAATVGRQCVNVLIGGAWVAGAFVALMTTKDWHQEVTEIIADGDLEALKEKVNNPSSANYVDSIDLSASSLLHTAVEENKPKIIRYLIESGANLYARNSSGETPLEMAVRLNQGYSIRALVAGGSDLLIKDKDGVTLQDRLIKQRHLFVQDKDGVTLLEKYIKQGQEEALGDLKLEETPEAVALFHKAVASDNYELAKFLTKSGISREAKDGHGRTALHIAAEFGQPRMVFALINSGVSVDARDSKGLTPLHRACYNKHAGCAVLLLDKGGADINAASNLGQTPLHTAMLKLNYQIALGLIKRGADYTVKDKNGSFPLFLKESETRFDQQLILVVQDGKYPNLEMDRAALLLMGKHPNKSSLAVYNAETGEIIGRGGKLKKAIDSKTRVTVICHGLPDCVGGSTGKQAAEHVVKVMRQEGIKEAPGKINIAACLSGLDDPELYPELPSVVDKYYPGRGKTLFNEPSAAEQFTRHMMALGYPCDVKASRGSTVFKSDTGSKCRVIKPSEGGLRWQGTDNWLGFFHECKWFNIESTEMTKENYQEGLKVAYRPVPESGEIEKQYI